MDANHSNSLMSHFKSRARKEIKDLIGIVIGIAIYSVGFTVFILPHKIVIGGMAGFSTLVYYITNGALPVAVTMYGTNILLLICSFRYLGKGFVAKTIFGTTLLSIMIGTMEELIGNHPAIVVDTTMSVGIGAVMLGLGLGLCYSHNGTSGGTDIVAAVASKFSDMSIGRVLMIVDVSIVACSFFLPFDGDMEARIQSRAQSIIYGWMAIFVYSYIADKFLAEGKQTSQFIIMSNRWERIADRITHETGRGVTTWDAEGFWTHNRRRVMLVWCRKYDTYRIMSIIKDEDPDAIITNAPVRSVYGNGFDHLRIKHRHTHTKERHI